MRINDTRIFLFFFQCVYKRFQLANSRLEILDLSLATPALPVHSVEVRISVDVDGRLVVTTLQPNSPR